MEDGAAPLAGAEPPAMRLLIVSMSTLTLFGLMKACQSRVSKMIFTMSTMLR